MKDEDGPAIKLKIWNPSSNRNVCGCMPTDASFFGDIVLALKFSESTDSVSDWSSCPNKQWPPPSEIERIKWQGCHLVAKTNLSAEQYTWRISFSKAEVELSQLVPETARVCFVAMKIIAKDYLSSVCKNLSSYHLKCIFLYDRVQKRMTK